MTASLALGPCTSAARSALSSKPGVPRRRTGPASPHDRRAAAQVAGDAAFAVPPAAASTIFARSTSRCALVPARTICSSLRRRLIVSLTGTARERPAIGESPSVPQVITEECRHNRADRRMTARPRVAPASAATRRQETLENMPVPSKRLKDLIEGTVDHHASLTCPDLQEVTIRWRGSFGYLTA